MSFHSQHYDFNMWEAAFDQYEELSSQYPDKVSFVLSQHIHTSGFWIEKVGMPLSTHDIVYSHDEVYKLKERIGREIKLAKQQGRTPKLIL